MKKKQFYLWMMVLVSQILLQSSQGYTYFEENGEVWNKHTILLAVFIALFFVLGIKEWIFYKKGKLD